MFLMNAPPVLALPSKWEAFGPPGSCRFPRCFSEPTEGVSRAAVSAKVHMVISTLQGDRAALGMSGEHARQRSQRAERGRGAGPAASPAFASCGLAAGFDPKGEEKAADLGPPVPDSDSDDSVDRDIEEAIQEYLKAKSGAAPPPTAVASRCKPEPPPSGAPAAPCPPDLAAGPDRVPCSLGGAGEDQGSTSPLSISSEDSFEQSIRAEIEQFLSEKRQHETQKCDVPASQKPDPDDSLATSACRSGKEPTAKAHQQDLAGPCKEFVFRKPPRSTKASVLSRGPRSKVTTDPATGRPAETAPSKGGVRRGAGPGRRGRRVRSAAPVHEVADSSSDDGIEEAIQRYQLEKRKEASGDPPPRTLPTEEKGLGPPAHAHGPGPCTRSAWPEAHGKTPGKKKSVATKAADLSPGGLDPDHPPRPPRETVAATPPGGTATKSASVDGSPCRADTSAELMCAEAILDISKTILPAPLEGSDRPPPASPLLCPPEVPSRSEDDSSSVDSDDSIEQEIRTFLALKAQAGGLLPRMETCLRPAHSALPPPSLGAPASKTPDLSLGCKRKRGGSGHAVRPCTPKRTRETAEAQEGAQDADRSQGRAQPSQGKASEAPGREGETRGQPHPCRTGMPGAEHGAPDMWGAVSPGSGKTAEVRRVDEKESSEDKSSSLDSDEDLDTAIKDLLRSKRRLRKRCKDPRAGCKKRVRFSTTETQFLDKLGGLQKDWKDRSPHLLKSCLSKSKKDSRESPGRPSHVLCRDAVRAKPDGLVAEDVPPAPRSRGRAAGGSLFSGELEARELHGPAPSPSSLSDDSSSIDSDDSIELEIRKFLAEKAKESVSGSEIQGGCPTALRTGSAARPELPCRKVPASGLALQASMCTRSQRGRGPSQPAEGPRGLGRASAPAGRSSPHAEQACLPAALAPPRSTSRTASAKGPPASRRSVCAPRDGSPRGAEATAGESAFGQLPEAGTGRSALARTPGTERDGGPRAGLALPWADFAPQSRLQSTWALSSDSRDVAAWRGGLGGQREKGPEGQVRGSPSLAMDPRRGLPFAGFSPLLSTQLFHFGKSVSWGGKQTSLFSPPLSLPLQGPSFSAFREAPVSHGPVFGSSHLLVKQEGGRWPHRRSRAGLSLPNRRTSGPEESILDLRCGRRGTDRDDGVQEALGSDASDFSDASVEEGSSPMAKGPTLQL
ncbi:protein phosphatase 1 regulatory subunit 26 [Hippopotamus amphibius kiboko]|uniref:protein phosphatase 1 regulatory subunit 26 n=1 Tax=Hippopotamus amphibius kiboko TaxID=575201 RepID=UPI0025980B00|nr:protein phosphatase 1 regulatory subunit 26 [Hippopotamus amphibius kiboko]XP_057580356.1 protein phosphatase 1 regulatory subunit 26 [Hippopotamus amphibius kiboko]XP_057580357.1 protein phosphatase 1 regulatory subunit 26 [Hippopotamus amphibius kiboko]XP_057580358.1 protein phosphatase 1 regulatory subunit 26 [Hippopotamus amphibius kiboko]XP_057580359.1 protein phosphatase 1 regulatory subunit 26 [Hippopotamus amphibius kiboko]